MKIRATAIVMVLPMTLVLGTPGRGAAALATRTVVDATGARVGHLETNGLLDPIGIGSGRPSLSWETVGIDRQSAYQIRAARTTIELSRGHGVTGRKTLSREVSGVPFTLLPLSSRSTVAWQVRVWGHNGRASAWSRPATFEVGLLHHRNWKASWIENASYDYTQPDGSATPLPVFAKTFTLAKKVAKARLYATGLGMYAATVNGRPAGNAVLEPGQTTYRREVTYRTYDVTRSLQRGRNVVGLETGSGAYQRVKTPGHYFFGNTLEQYVVYGEPKVVAQLEIEYTDGSRRTIASDPTWRTALGPTTYSSWWSGEEYDARRAGTAPTSAAIVSGAGWTNASRASLSATTTPTSTTPLVADPRPPVVTHETVLPQSVTKVGDSYVLDFGANRAAWPMLSPASLPAGSTVSMVPAEKLNADGTLDTSSTGVNGSNGVIAYKYTSAGGPSPIWHPQFTYSGFRYLRLDGLAAPPRRDLVKATALYADNQRASSFESSDPVLNGIHAITLRSMQSNMLSVLTDCPNREKGPYTGDNLHNLDALLTDYDMDAYQSQLVRNMVTAQRGPGDESPGLIANIAPEFHRVLPTKLNFPQGVIEFLDEVNWGGAVIRIPWKLYETYGDTKTMRRAYPAMVRWLDYEAANRAANNGDIPGLGDWTAFDNTTPMQLAIYAGYYTAANDMSKIAGVLGKRAARAKYRSLSNDLRSTFNQRFRHVDSAGVYYGSDSESSNAMALDAGLVAPGDIAAVRSRLVAAVRRSGNHITGGSVGLGPLFRALQDAGRDDVIYDLVTNPTSPGYGYLLATGHTTLSEDFRGGGSQNHHFLGQVDNWFVSGIAGIRQAKDSVGFRKLVVKPAFVGGLTRARGSYDTPFGTVSSSWLRQGSATTVKVQIPSGTTAAVVVPRGTVKASKGGTAVRTEHGYRVTAGEYVFVSRS